MCDWSELCRLCDQNFSESRHTLVYGRATERPKRKDEQKLRYLHGQHFHPLGLPAPALFLAAPFANLVERVNFVSGSLKITGPRHAALM